MASAGIGSQETFALNALAATGDPKYVDTFRYKLASAGHLETELAAARGLGRLGYDDGFQLALRALRSRRRRIQDAEDPVADQVLRARQLAAAALGAIGRTEALPALAGVLRRCKDARVQVSAARAILGILRLNRVRRLPFRRPMYEEGGQVG